MNIMSNTNIKFYGTSSIYLLSRLCATLYCPSQRKRHLYGNLASWMMVQAPPTIASLFWFYYSLYNESITHHRTSILDATSSEKDRIMRSTIRDRQYGLAMLPIR